MEKIKTGIIGCGKVAYLHASALNNIQESEFVGVWSRTFSKAQKFTEIWTVLLQELPEPDFRII